MSRQRYFKSFPPGILWLGVVSLLNDLSSEVVIRVLPLFLLAVVKTTIVGVGVVEAVSEATAIFGRLIAGFLSDRMKSRKPFILAGYAISVAARPILLLTGGLAPAVVSRFADKIGKSVRTAPRDALIADLSSDRDRGRNYGMHRALDTVGAALGLSGVVIFLFLRPHNETSDLWWCLAAAAVVGTLTIPAIVFFVHDPPQSQAAISATPRLSFKNLDVRFKKYLPIAFFFALANSSDAFIIVRARDLGFSAPAIFLVILAFNFVSIPSYVGLAQWSDRIGRKHILTAGWVIYGISYYVLGVPGLSAGVFVATLLFYGLYYGFTDGVEKALIADINTSGKGQAFGWLALVQGVGVVPANLLFAWFYQKMGAAAAFWFSGAMAFAGSGLLCFYNPSKRK